MTSIEELDLTEILAYRHAETPLWNALLDDYDAEAVEAINTSLSRWEDLQEDEDPEDEPGRYDECDECGETKTDIECVGGAMWCKGCRDYLASKPGPTAEDYAAMDMDGQE